MPTRLTKSRQATSRKRRGEPEWVCSSDEELLNLRLCDLGVKLEGTMVEHRIDRIRVDLERKNLCFRPHFWISEEWFSPDGVPGVAIPFYLAHPRLIRLERAQMLDVEGGTKESCLRLLRHEVGHAFDNAYRFHRKKRYRELFGRASKRYPDYYLPRPYSKKYVLHLDMWYAQSHPSEDFAETFAVWLNPRSMWRRRYQGWPALKKLLYVDELMAEIQDQKPPVRNRQHVDTLRTNKTRLRDHYKRKRAWYGEEYPDFYDRDLRRLFSDKLKKGEFASTFLKRVKPEIRRLVSKWTGEHQYTIDQVLSGMINRSRELKLRMDRSDDQAKLEAVILLTLQTVNYLHSGRHRVMV